MYIVLNLICLLTIVRDKSRGTTCKEAIQRWAETNNKEAGEATEIYLGFQWPPIEKMDNSLAALSKVQ